jgi:hypothetical protein
MYNDAVTFTRMTLHQIATIKMVNVFGDFQSDECHSTLCHSAECCGTLLIPVDLCVEVDQHHRHSSLLL